MIEKPFVVLEHNDANNRFLIVNLNQMTAAKIPGEEGAVVSLHFSDGNVLHVRGDGGVQIAKLIVSRAVTCAGDPIGEPELEEAAIVVGPAGQ